MAKVAKGEWAEDRPAVIAKIPLDNLHILYLKPPLILQKCAQALFTEVHLKGKPLNPPPLFLLTIQTNTKGFFPGQFPQQSERRGNIRCFSLKQKSDFSCEPIDQSPRDGP